MILLMPKAVKPRDLIDLLFARALEFDKRGMREKSTALLEVARKIELETEGGAEAEQYSWESGWA